jgi:Ca2+ transporting ATPase
MLVDQAWLLTPEKVLAELKVDADQGLSSTEANLRLRLYGPNALAPPEPTPLWRLVLNQFKETLVLILLASAFISFVLAFFEDSEHRATAFIEPVVILLILILNATVGVVQETNAEKAIEACVFLHFLPRLQLLLILILDFVLYPETQRVRSHQRQSVSRWRIDRHVAR